MAKTFQMGADQEHCHLHWLKQNDCEMEAERPKDEKKEKSPQYVNLSADHTG
jgi:hypothetical protein